MAILGLRAGRRKWQPKMASAGNLLKMAAILKRFPAIFGCHFARPEQPKPKRDHKPRLKDRTIGRRRHTKSVGSVHFKDMRDGLAILVWIASR